MPAPALKPSKQKARPYPSRRELAPSQVRVECLLGLIGTHSYPGVRQGREGQAQGGATRHKCGSVRAGRGDSTETLPEWRGRG